MGRDWRIRRDEGDRIDRDDRDIGRDVRRGDRDEYRERDMEASIRRSG